MTQLATDIPIAPSRPHGHAEKRDREALLALLLLDTDDAELAAQEWERLAPAPYRGLLRATPIDDARAFTGTFPPIWFDVRNQRYGLSSRGYIVYTALLAAVEEFSKAAQEEGKAATALLFAGGDLSQWQQDMEDRVRMSALAGAVAGAGGIEQVTDKTLSAASRTLTMPINRLGRFARQIDAGIVAEPEAERRAAMYPASVTKPSYESARRFAHVDVDFDQEQNVLGVADHCGPDPRRPNIPDCPSLTRLGWVKIGSMPEPGARVCLFNCACHLAFRRSDDANQ